MNSGWRREGCLFSLVAIVTLCAWTLFAGKDVSWDLINHHLYLPFSLLSGRYDIDLFAANAQSYQNPLAYVPFYLLVSAGLPAWVVGMLLALLHALCAIPLWLLTRRLWPAAEDRDLRALALLLAFVAPIFLLTAGTSSTDPISNLLVLSALALATCGGQGLRYAVAAGALMGIAFGLKPTNAVLLAAGAAAMLARVMTGHASARTLAAQTAGALVGALLAMGGWASWLWQTFGNPTYPLFNQWFQSPYAPLEPMTDLRFVPTHVSALWTRLLDLAALRNYVHTEALAPDLRPLALGVLGIAAMLATALSLHRARQAEPGPRRTTNTDTLSITVFVVTGYGLWLFASGNSRYVIPLFMLCGLLLAKAAQVALPRRAAPLVLALLAAVQFYFALDGERRYQARPWDARSYLDVEVPARLQQQGFLHLSIGIPSFAGLAPYLAHDGAFINLMGQFSLPTTGALGDALQRRLQQWQGKTRFLMQVRDEPTLPTDIEAFRRRADHIVRRFGLAFDWRDCEDVLIHLHARGSHDANGRPLLPVRVRSCAAKPGMPIDADEKAALAAAEAAFTAVETQCPRIFGPTPMATDGDLEAWQRRYLNSNARLTLSKRDGMQLSHFRSARAVFIGSADDIRAGRGKNACAAWAELGIP